MKDAGGEIKVLNALNPQSDDGTLDVGNIIDTLGYESCVFAMLYGANSGSATGIVDSVKIEEGDDSALSDAADVTGATLSVEDPAAGDENELNMDLRSRKRYIRLSSTVVFTGGTSPELLKSATCALGQSYINPAV